MVRDVAVALVGVVRYFLVFNCCVRLLRFFEPGLANDPVCSRCPSDVLVQVNTAIFANFTVYVQLRVVPCFWFSHVCPGCCGTRQLLTRSVPAPCLIFQGARRTPRGCSHTAGKLSFDRRRLALAGRTGSDRQLLSQRLSDSCRRSIGKRTEG